jgi:hypothetical protein
MPKRQTNTRDKWLAARQQELLPVDYYHLVFSVPHSLAPLIWQNKKMLLKLLFEASAETLLESCRRSQTSGRRDWFPECASHLGAESSDSSSFIAD